MFPYLFNGNYPFNFNDTSGTVNPEANLYASIAQESFELFGWNVVYLTKNYFNEVFALGEFQTRIVENATYLRMYLEQVQGLERSNLYSKFGYFPNDSGDAYITKQQLENANIQLQAGDLLYIPVMSKLFEIESFSARDNKSGDFFFGGLNPVYHIYIRLYYPDQQQTNPELLNNINLPEQSALLSPPITEAEAQIDIQNIMNILEINENNTNQNNTNIQTSSTSDINNTEVDPLNS